MVEHTNVHLDKIYDESCIMTNEDLDDKRINPVMCFFEMFPLDEMKKCVDNFNRMVEKEMKLKLRDLYQKKNWRYKNNKYFKFLTLREFQVFIGLLFASTTRAESGISLWRSEKKQGINSTHRLISEST